MIQVELLLVVAAVATAGGLVKGFSGFGFALVSTGILSVLLGPPAAVTLLILPVLATNLSLLREMEKDEISRCAKRFWPYMISAIAGTAVGMALLDSVPSSTVKTGLGVLTLGYVVFHDTDFEVPENSLFSSVTGFVSGTVFGSTNIAVPVVAYFDSMDMDRSIFIGMLAFMMIGVSAVRAILAFFLGLYSVDLAGLSALVAMPALAGIFIGSRFRTVVPEKYRNLSVMVLLTVIGFRLLLP